MEAKIDQTIEYSQSVKRDSEYKFSKLIQNTGGESISVSSAQQSSTFEIPVVGMNLAKSFINFTQRIPQSTTGTHFAHGFRDTPPWSRLELYTRGGTYLMDVTNFSHIYQAFGQRTKKIDDFGGSKNGVVIRNYNNFAGTVSCPTIPAGQPDIVRPVVYTATPSSFQAIQKEVFNGVAASGGPRLTPTDDRPGDINVQWKIPGRELYNTVMSLDKTLLLGEVVNLRITWREAAAHGYWTSDAAGANPVNVGAPVLISKLALYLAQETNPMVMNELTQVVSTSGMSVIIPYTHAYKTSLTGTSNAISLRFSRGHGISLERIYTVFGTGLEEKNTRYDSKLLQDGKTPADADYTQVDSFYSLLNSKRMQEFDINVRNVDYDWMNEGEKKDRVVSIDLTNDNTNFAHTENWCGDDLECAIHQHLGGLSLDVEKKYDLYVTKNSAATAATINYYSAAVCQKMLMMGPSGVQVS